jgi:release factor glutamine methyltransferase
MGLSHALPQTALTLRGAFAGAAAMLRQAGVPTPELDARLLICHAAGVSHESYVARPDWELAPDAAAQLRRCIERRLDGEPVSRILGQREFWGRAFLVDRHTLDPRPDTETLIEVALGLVASQGLREQPLRLLDLGTGTGCILLTLLAELPNATGVGTDRSVPALALASANARRLGVDDRAAFLAGDWLEPVSGSFDLILANPPYVATGEIGRLPREVGAYDPWGALDGGTDGLDAYRRIAGGVRRALRPGGAILLEVGAEQADRVLSLLREAGLAIDGKACMWRDLGGRPRVVAAREGGRLPSRPNGREPKKGAWKITMFGIGSSTAEGSFSAVDAKIARGRLQAATRADISCISMKGGVPLGTFRRRSTAHLS